MPKVKEELQEKPSFGAGFGVKAELPLDASGFPIRVKSELETQREEEVERKRKESARRDLACKAICRVKRELRLRQRAAGTTDALYVVLPGWDADFRDHLGDYLAFLRSRPDQFLVEEGDGVSLAFTVTNVAGTTTVEAPAWGSWRNKREDRAAAATGPGPQARGPPSVIHGTRERVAGGERTTGEVIRWCGGFGWIKPSAPIDHPAAVKHNGDLFVHASDVIGTSSLERGMEVDFFVYADKSGLGAEECLPCRLGGKAVFNAFGAGKAVGKAAGRGGKGKVGTGKAADRGGKAAGREGPRRRGIAAKDEGDGSQTSSPKLLPAQTLRPLAPLRLGTPLGGSCDFGPGAAVAVVGSKAEEETEIDLGGEEEAVEAEAEPGKEEEEDDDDGVEAMGFTVDGEEDEEDDAEALGFTVDGEADGDAAAPGITPADSFDIWSLLGDEQPAAPGARPMLLKRGPCGGAAGSVQELKRPRT